MGYARHIGRVGALAVTLGVGVAMTALLWVVGGRGVSIGVLPREER